jgi:hypothetical protein
MRVQPRPTPAERADETIEIPVDEALSVFVATMEDWVAQRQEWDLEVREGTDTGRRNNIEVVLTYVAGSQTTSLSFRLDQLDAVDDTGQELVLRIEETQDGIAKLAVLMSNGIDVELFHILTTT